MEPADLLRHGRRHGVEELLLHRLGGGLGGDRLAGSTARRAATHPPPPGNPTPPASSAACGPASAEASPPYRPARRRPPRLPARTVPVPPPRPPARFFRRGFARQRDLVERTLVGSDQRRFRGLGLLAHASSCVAATAGSSGIASLAYACCGSPALSLSKGGSARGIGSASGAAGTDAATDSESSRAVPTRSLSSSRFSAVSLGTMEGGLADANGVAEIDRVLVDVGAVHERPLFAIQVADVPLPVHSSKISACTVETLFSSSDTSHVGRRPTTTARPWRNSGPVEPSTSAPRRHRLGPAAVRRVHELEAERTDPDHVPVVQVGFLHRPAVDQHVRSAGQVADRTRRRWR